MNSSPRQEALHLAARIAASGRQGRGHHPRETRGQSWPEFYKQLCVDVEHIGLHVLDVEQCHVAWVGKRLTGVDLIAAFCRAKWESLAEPGESDLSRQECHSDAVLPEAVRRRHARYGGVGAGPRRAEEGARHGTAAHRLPHGSLAALLPAAEAAANSVRWQFTHKTALGKQSAMAQKAVDAVVPVICEAVLTKAKKELDLP